MFTPLAPIVDYTVTYPDGTTSVGIIHTNNQKSAMTILRDCYPDAVDYKLHLDKDTQNAMFERQCITWLGYASYGLLAFGAGFGLALAACANATI